MENILQLHEIGLGDLPRVGGKNASLGEMITQLGGLGVRIPSGFAITVQAYEAYLDFNGFRQEITSLVGSINPDDVVDLRKKGNLVRQLIRNGSFPPAMEGDICKAYKDLSGLYGQ